MSSNSYVNLKIATCLVRYADDRLIDQRFLKSAGFPESGGNRDFFRVVTLAVHPLRAGTSGRRPELFFIFLFPADAIEENSSG
ncbi:hypothetical protein [Burkholderia cenocepacia]|uniref:hypothetical protein n=1 Tax=Burkholderia cenocepacia TaxID=95486 RepID=UPI00117878B6|nr:hypothetical protein [Burkholderia cenocepacia]